MTVPGSDRSEVIQGGKGKRSRVVGGLIYLIFSGSLKKGSGVASELPDYHDEEEEVRDGNQRERERERERDFVRVDVIISSPNSTFYLPDVSGCIVRVFLPLVFL